MVKSIIGSISSAFNNELIGAEQLINIDEESIAVKQFRAVDYYVPGLIAAFIMTNGLIAVTANTTEFKRRGVIKRLATTPLTRLEWVVGNVLAQTLLAFILTGVMISVGWLVFGVTGIPGPYAIIMIILGAILFSGMGLALSGVIKDVEAASAAGNAIAFPMMFLSGSFFPIEIMPQFLQDIAKFLPLTYLSDGLRFALISDYLQGVYVNMAIIAVLAVVFILIGAAITRWQEK